MVHLLHRLYGVDAPVYLNEEEPALKSPLQVTVLVIYFCAVK